MRARRGGALTLATVGLLVCACGELDIVDHDPLLLDPEGNFPAEVEERCGTLPPGVGSIPGLTSAWLSEVPVKEGEVSPRAAATSKVLRLSDDGVPCGDPLDPELIGCPRAWAVDISLRTAAFGPGTFALDDYAQSWHLATATRVEDGVCERDQELGVFEGGQLEIFTLTDACVVGRLVATTDEIPVEGGPVEGGFVALRCESEG
ncbi:hypothetical protein [Paraliomyxa miuraensis]|uniref:hypothetical protein n=1 Tax=Paraliomyxa miuraensis TaxID=376150 RepID=UPI0022517991|nr:hypothetical protein [Paraliomyxa miuraensis]MCX4246869.1 hypothetical protein [Paraliomyxa miuraensis]